MKLPELVSAQALRSCVVLEPIDGPGGRIHPPTYPAAEGAGDKSARHAAEQLPNGQWRVLVDSIASQANRQEAALVAARDQGLINFSDVYVDLSGTDAAVNRHLLSATEMPHRLSDAILRDSELDGALFNRSELGKRILSATPSDLSVLLESSPTTVLFGCWFSQHKMSKPLKIQRSVVSEIWADDAVLSKVVGSRIDPLGIEKLKLFEAPDGDWTALEEKAVQSKGKAKLHKQKRPSEVNHGNIAPDIRELGITAASVTLRWAMPLAAVRRLHFGGGDRDRAGQAYVVALGILARVLDHGTGYSLRSRCDLIGRGPIKLDVIDGEGAISEVIIGSAEALKILNEAEKGMREAGLALHQKIIAKPSQKLIDLIAANRRRQEVGAEAGDEEAAS